MADSCFSTAFLVEGLLDSSGCYANQTRALVCSSSSLHPPHRARWAYHWTTKAATRTRPAPCGSIAPQIRQHRRRRRGRRYAPTQRHSSRRWRESGARTLDGRARAFAHARVTNLPARKPGTSVTPRPDPGCHLTCGGVKRQPPAADS
jgi:hypothetical protein